MGDLEHTASVTRSDQRHGHRFNKHMWDFHHGAWEDIGFGTLAVHLQESHEKSPWLIISLIMTLFTMFHSKCAEQECFNSYYLSSITPANVISIAPNLWYNSAAGMVLCIGQENIKVYIYKISIWKKSHPYDTPKTRRVSTQHGNHRSVNSTMNSSGQPMHAGVGIWGVSPSHFAFESWRMTVTFSVTLFPWCPFYHCTLKNAAKSSAFWSYQNLCTRPERWLSDSEWLLHLPRARV